MAEKKDSVIGNIDGVQQNLKNKLSDNIIHQNKKKSRGSAKFKENNISTDVFRQIKEQITMTEVAEYYGLSLNHAGFCRCPFHSEKTPSFKVYAETNSFYCFGCGKGGDAIAFVMKMFKLGNISAAKKLNMDFRLNLPIGKRLTKKEYQKSIITGIRREKSKTLVGDFEEWEKKAFMIVKNYWHSLRDTSDIIYSENAPDLQNHIGRMSELSYIEFLLDTIIENTGNFPAQVKFYKDYGKAVSRIEQRSINI